VVAVPLHRMVQQISQSSHASSSSGPDASAAIPICARQ
jgi:hypothetical protein